MIYGASLLLCECVQVAINKDAQYSQHAFGFITETCGVAQFKTLLPQYQGNPHGEPKRLQAMMNNGAKYGAINTNVDNNGQFKISCKHLSPQLKMKSDNKCKNVTYSCQMDLFTYLLLTLLKDYFFEACVKYFNNNKFIAYYFTSTVCSDMKRAARTFNSKINNSIRVEKARIAGGRKSKLKFDFMDSDVNDAESRMYNIRTLEADYEKDAVNIIVDTLKSLLCMLYILLCDF